MPSPEPWVLRHSERGWKVNHGRIQFALLAKKQLDLMMKLIDLHIRFVDISGQIAQTEEFGLLTSLATTVFPALKNRMIGSVYWVYDSAKSERKFLAIDCFSTDLVYPDSDTIDIPLEDIPPAVLEEFDRQWENISQEPWIPPRKLSRRPARKRRQKVIEIQKRSR